MPPGARRVAGVGRLGWQPQFSVGVITPGEALPNTLGVPPTGSVLEAQFFIHVRLKLSGAPQETGKFLAIFVF